MKNLLIVTDLSFPKGSAMASRIISFCHLFNDLGYKVHVITGKLEDKNVKCNQIINEDYYSYEVVDSKRNYRLQSYLGNENLPIRVYEYLKNNNVDLVFTTSLNANFKKVFDVCKKHNKKIILEQCEWFDASSYRFKKLDPRYRMFLNNIKNNFVKADGVIAISRLLYDYYKQQNIKVIRIPSILDINNAPYNVKNNNEKVKLVYTGNPSKSKELLEPILKALTNHSNEFTFDIYGLNKNQLLNNINNNQKLLDELKDTVKVHGFVSQDKIQNILMQANYQIFIRPNRKSSNAGFPTKLAESMCVGTPVITNDTGDICLYVKDESNGYIARGIKEENINEIFEKILNYKDNDIRTKARQTALDSFDYRVYLKEVEDLINSL